ncbi:MAG TPA: uracil-DNA glycosylase [Candidatus Saccharimonadales bacterium]|nr:uracil-DNA glycosylase [Candidatus Saccharimonadales bacterium]
MTTQEKQKALDAIAKEIENCATCKAGKSGKAVPGEGNADANVIFIGEAPGKKEAETGKPFIGRSGKLLRNLIQEAGLKEEEIFITSPVKYLPDRGTPIKADIIHGMIHTQKQLDCIDPNLIILLGSVATQGVLNEKISVMKKHGEVVERNGKKYMIMFHPSAALRFPKIRKELTEDFKKLHTLISSNL